MGNTISAKKPDAAASFSVDEIHIDEFLNAALAAQQKVESLAAFAKVQKSKGVIKQPPDYFEAAFREFEQSKP